MFVTDWFHADWEATCWERVKAEVRIVVGLALLKFALAPILGILLILLAVYLVASGAVQLSRTW